MPRALWLAVAVALFFAAPSLAAEGRSGYRTKIAAEGRGTGAKVPVRAAAAQGELPTAKEAVLGDSHDENIAALQRQKLELLKQREELVRRAVAIGKSSQNQLDQITMDVLRAELEWQNRPHLRIEALEKILEIQKRFEAEADENWTRQARSNDPGAILSAHGRLMSTKLGRIGTQINIEREKAAMAREAAKDGK